MHKFIAFIAIFGALFIGLSAQANTCQIESFGEYIDDQSDTQLLIQITNSISNNTGSGTREYILLDENFIPYSLPEAGNPQQNVSIRYFFDKSPNVSSWLILPMIDFIGSDANNYKTFESKLIINELRPFRRSYLGKVTMVGYDWVDQCRNLDKSINDLTKIPEDCQGKAYEVNVSKECFELDNQ